ncbi:MAG: prepilin-type N-terminal cleavage/methylation domain-containing protein [Planctomycetota bacterium]
MNTNSQEGFTQLEMSKATIGKLLYNPSQKDKTIVYKTERSPTGDLSLTGFTLIELMIVVTILTGMLVGAMYVIISSQNIYTEGAMESYLESEGMRLTDIIKEDINECFVITGSMPTTSNNYATLTLKVPVKVGGNYWDPATGAIYWGANDNQNWYIIYDFVPNNPTPNLVEATTHLDYNGDGDIIDSFDTGNLWKYVYNAGGVLQEQVNLGGNIITVATNRYLDINNDGANDPIFSLRDKNNNLVTSGSNGNRVRINLWFGGVLGAGQKPIIVDCKTDVVLLNPQ